MSINDVIACLVAAGDQTQICLVKQLSWLDNIVDLDSGSERKPV